MLHFSLLSRGVLTGTSLVNISRIAGMGKLTVELGLETPVAKRTYSKGFSLERDRSAGALDFLADAMFRECQMQTLYGPYRAILPDFEGLSVGTRFPKVMGDLTRSAAHTNTFDVWFLIRNVLLEAAHFISQARAYHDLELAETDENSRMLLHLIKIQDLNSSAHLICKVQDLFLLLLFVNSACSLIPSIDVRAAGWEKEIRRVKIDKGLKKRKTGGFCGRFRKTNPYLNALSDEEYRTVRTVLRNLRRRKSLAIVRSYRDAIAHQGQPAVDISGFSTQFTFPKRVRSGIELAISVGTKVEYKFLDDLYPNFCDALKQLEVELLRTKQIPVLTPAD
jgi:hypothetical protein